MNLASALAVFAWTVTIVYGAIGFMMVGVAFLTVRAARFAWLAIVRARRAAGRRDALRRSRRQYFQDRNADIDLIEHLVRHGQINAAGMRAMERASRRLRADQHKERSR